MFSEKKLIEECIAGNRKAQKQLYTQYNALFFTICLRYTQTREEAEDILITGFTSIFEALSMYKYKGSFEGWMKRIIINTAIDHYRTNRKHLLDVEIENIENLSNGNTEIYQKLEAKEIIKKIQMMPEGYKQIFNLYAIEGYKHIEIAKLLQISESTSKSQYAKAKKWLQIHLEDNK